MDVEAFDDSGLGRVGRGHDRRAQAVAPRHQHHGQDAGDRSQRAVQGQLTDTSSTSEASPLRPPRRRPGARPRWRDREEDPIFRKLAGAMLTVMRRSHLNS